MAKQSRQKPARPARKKPPVRSATPGRRGASATANPAPAQPAAEKPGQPPAPPPRKPGYYEAVAIYETGVLALQRHDFEKAASQFRQVIERYPAERELHERSVLYLRVCERELARRAPVPQTPQERVYAATVALNAGDQATALDHLRRAISEAPDSDHAHYIMAVALASFGHITEALGHLQRSIALNPDNRSLARQDPDLENVRDLDGFRAALDAGSDGSRSRSVRRRR